MSTPDVPAQGAPAPIAPLAPSGSFPVAPAPVAPVAPTLPAPPDLSQPSSLDAPASSVEDHSPPNPAVEDNSLGHFFGVDPGLDTAGQNAVLHPLLQTLVDSGRPQAAPIQQQPVPGQPVQNDPSLAPAPAPAAAPTPTEFDVNSFDFGDAPIGIKEAIIAMQGQNAAAIAAANQQTVAAQKAATDAQESFQQQQVYLQQQESTRMAERAHTYLDSLQDARFGVGENRTMMQQIATNKLLDTATALVRGISSHGGQQPPVEKILEMAVLYAQGAPVAPAAAGLIPNVLAPGYSPQGAVPAAPAQHSGSAGAGGSLMDDAAFMEGARAILSR